MLRVRLLLIVPALLLGALAPAAQGQTTALQMYQVETRGSGEQSYNRSGEDCFGTTWSDDMSATWNWTTKQQAEMIGGELELVGPAQTTVQLGAASLAKHRPSCTTAGTITSSCVSTGLRSPAAAIGTRIEPHAMTDAGQPVTVAGWGQVFAKMDNCSGPNPPGGDMILIAPKPAETTILPTEQGTTFSRSLSGVLTGKDCPWYDNTVKSCKYGWQATVTFKRLQMPTGPGGKPVPRPPAGQPQGPPSWPGTPGVPHNPPPSPGPSGPSGGGGPGTPPGPTPGGPKGGGISIGGGKLGPGARKANVKVKCAAGCKLSAEAIARQRQPKKGGKGGKKRRTRARAAAAASVLGRAQKTLEPGVETDVELRFSAATARAIRRAGGAVLVLRITPRGGTAVTRRVALRA